jgi:hypothetical protein
MTLSVRLFQVTVNGNHVVVLALKNSRQLISASLSLDEHEGEISTIPSIKQIHEEVAFVI